MGRWFVVAQHIRWQWPEKARNGVRMPTSVAHAKEMGTLLAACGRPVHGWERLWDAAFPMRGTDACPECLEVVRSAPGNSQSIA
jgi:hypothetical protein